MYFLRILFVTLLSFPALILAFFLTGKLTEEIKKKNQEH